MGRLPTVTERSVGVEEEFLLLRDGELRLAAEGDAVVDAANEADDDAQFEHELMQAQAELASRPTTSLASLSRDLRTLRSKLSASCVRAGVRLVASGTSPLLGRARTTADHRYQQMIEQFGQIARQQLTCGMHIHVSVESDREGVQAVDGVAPWLPVLTALSANSPFYAGRDTDYASYRSILWGQWPTAGPTATFGDPVSYHALCRQLIASGAARDDGMIYFDVRLSATYPTVEIRACDVCRHADDAVVLAGLARALVDYAVTTGCGERMTRDIGPGLLRAASWRAARFGMTDQLVDLVGSSTGPRLMPAWDAVDDLLQRVAPVLEERGDLTMVTDGLANIRKRGTGAAQQRSVYSEAGDFADVLDSMAIA